MSLTNVLKGIGGEFEIGRVLLAFAGFSGVVSPVAFVTYEIVWNGGHFDVTAFCLAYPGGLATLVGAGVLGIGRKDQNVAAARQVQAMPPLDDNGP